MHNPLRIVVFASGNGGNAENIARVVAEFPSEMELVCAVTDRADAGVIEKMQALNIPCYVVPFSGDRHAHEEKILSILASTLADWIFLAGYMRIFSPQFVEKYNNRIVNIHPSLLPAFPGRDAYGQAWRAGAEICGVTLHYVDAGIDTGAVIAQEKFMRQADDTFADFTARGCVVEYRLYRDFITEMAKQNIKGRKWAAQQG